jgi:predicted DNA-binding transcriptional regulator AlpA
MQPRSSEPEWIAPKDAARLLGTSTDYVYRHHADVGWPRSMRIGIRIRWRRSEFCEWIERRFDRQPVERVSA